MKKRIISFAIFCASISIMACNGENSNAKGHKVDDSTKSTNQLINSAGNNVPEEYKEGANLVTSNDCLTCHKINEKLVGPAFVTIADKYEMNEGNINNLYQSIKKGSSGIYGTQVMTPHPNLTPQDGTAMAKYILSLRTNK